MRLSQKAGYENRTRVTGMGNQRITTMLIPRKARAINDGMPGQDDAS
jgi:hypothetical protein